MDSGWIKTRNDPRSRKHLLNSCKWDEWRVDELFWRVEMHSSPSFNGPPPAPPPPFPSSFSFFLLFMFSCFAVSAWVSTVGGVTCLNACTRGVTIFDQRRWQSASCLAKHIFLRSLRVQHVLTFSEPNLWEMFESLLARLAPVFGVWGMEIREKVFPR